MVFSKNFIDNLVDKTLEKRFPGVKGTPHLNHSVADISVDLQHMMMYVLNKSDITMEVKAKLIPILMEELLEKYLPAFNKQEPLPKHEFIISLKEIEYGLRVVFDQMQSDHFIPTDVVSIADGGGPIAYHFCKKFNISSGSVRFKSYQGMQTGELIETTSKLFSLDFSKFSTEELAKIKLVIVDDLTETSRTMKEVYERIRQEFIKRGFDEQHIRDHVKTATLFAKNPEDYTADYVYRKDVGLDTWVTFPCETILPETQT